MFKIWFNVIRKPKNSGILNSYAMLASAVRCGEYFSVQETIVLMSANSKFRIFYDFFSHSVDLIQKKIKQKPPTKIYKFEP